MRKLITLIVLLTLGTSVSAQVEIEGLTTGQGQFVITTSGKSTGPKEWKEYRFKNPANKLYIAFNNVHIEGYNGDEVIISRHVESKNLDERAEGLQEIGLGGGVRDNTGMGLSVQVGEGGAVVHRVNMNATDSISIKVPQSTVLLTVQGTSIGPSGNQGRSISVSNLSNTIEISNMVGGIKLDNVSGPVTVSIIQGGIDATFKAPIKGPFVFTATQGHVDIAMPENTAADLDILYTSGELFAAPAFHITPMLMSEEDEKKDTIEIAEGNRTFAWNFNNSLHRFSAMPRGESLRRAGLMQNQIKGRINGGGENIIIRTTQGKIYLRTTEK